MKYIFKNTIILMIIMSSDENDSYKNRIMKIYFKTKL